MSELSKRIKSLRLSAGMTQEEFGKRFGIVKSTVSLYESGKSTPNDELKKKICDFFNVSLDYLLGREDDLSPQSEKDDDVQIDNFTTSEQKRKSGFFFFFFDCWDECLSRIRGRLRELNIDESEFCSDLQVDLNKEISISDLKSIANRLNVSTDYLLGVSDDGNSEQSLSEREEDIIECFRKLNKDNQDIIVGELKKCLKEQRYEESVAADPIRKASGK